MNLFVPGLAVFRVAGISSCRLLLAVACANCANLPWPILEADYAASGIERPARLVGTTEVLGE